METTWPIAKINGKVVYGQAHIQPGVNNWIGICIIPKNLLGDDPDNWKSAVIEYEGRFNYEDEHINGKGEAKMLHFETASQKNRFIVNIEGIGEPDLEKRLEKELKFGYNKNLSYDKRRLKKR